MNSDTDTNAPGTDPIYLIDGYGMIYRSYFAFIRSPMINAKGQNTSAIFGFFRVLASFIKQYKPHYLGVAMDSRTPTFRDELYAEYKATRQSTPDDLIAQFPVIEAIMTALGLPMLRVDGFEADDIMATIAFRCSQEQRRCVLISADKDMLQLVRPGIQVLKPAREGGFSEMDRQAVFEDKGVWPEQILDYLSLLGDASDNIPGVKGIGEKSATKLLEEFSSLDGIYAGIDAITSASQKQKLIDGKESAYFSKLLVTLREDVEIPGFTADNAGDCWAPLHIEGFNGPAAAALLRENGINQLAAEIARLGDQTATAPAGKAEFDFDQDQAKPELPASVTGGNVGAESAQPSSAAHKKAYDPQQQNYELVDSIARLQSVADAIRKAGLYVLDTETDGLDPHTSRLVGISLSIELDQGWYIPLWGPVDANGLPINDDAPTARNGTARIGKMLDEDQVRAILKPVIEDASLRLVGQNIKFDYQILKAWGVTMANPWFDTMIAAWLADTIANQYGMDSLARDLLGYETIHFSDLFDGMGPLPTGTTEMGGLFDLGDLPLTAPMEGATDNEEDESDIPAAKKSGKATKLKPADMLFSRIPVGKAAIYSAEDADITYRLFLALEPKLAALHVDKLFRELEMPLVALLAEIEWRGMYLQAGKLHEFSAELSRRLAETEQEIFTLVGHPFNISSTKQLQEVLFVERKLQGTKKTRTGYSTDTSVLEELASEDPVPQKILEYRGLAKLKSTYADSLPLMINPKTKRVHTSLIQTGTATGRIASKDPNLQNIPIKEADGRRIREAFIPAPGHVFISADYSQIELVVLAHYAEDPGLTAAFMSGQDVHRATGSLIFGVTPEEVSAEQRRIAKTINFGVMYGMSAYRLSRELGIPGKQAQAFINAYFATYSGIRRFIDATVKQAEIDGGVRTMLGRYRPIPAINSRNRTEKNGAERIAVNTPIQGTAADIVKLAMLAVDRRLKQEKLSASIVLQVHDELILEAPEAEKAQVMQLMVEEMSAAVSLNVPLRSSVEAGYSWGAMH